MSGEKEDRYFILASGDMRVALSISKNDYTIKFNRKNRFLLDDTESTGMIAFDLTKPLRIGNVYNGKGVLKFVLSESASTPYDNMELGIPDYYKYFPDPYHMEESSYDVSPKKGVWI